MTRYDFLWARWVILSNVQINWTWHNFTFGQLCMWIGENYSYGWMSDSEQWSTWTFLNFTFGQFLMWIGANNDQIWLPMDKTSDSGLIASTFLCETRQIMPRYDFLLHRHVILSNVRTDSQLDLILLINFSCELGQIMTKYDLLGTRLDWVILSNFKPTPTWPNFDFGKLLNWGKQVDLLRKKSKVGLQI